MGHLVLSSPFFLYSPVHHPPSPCTDVLFPCGFRMARMACLVQFVRSTYHAETTCVATSKLSTCFLGNTSALFAIKHLQRNEMWTIMCFVNTQKHIHLLQKMTVAKDSSLWAWQSERTGNALKKLGSIYCFIGTLLQLIVKIVMECCKNWPSPLLHTINYLILKQ